MGPRARSKTPGSWGLGLHRLVLVSCLAALHLAVWFQRSIVLPQPYMDEKFHVPQAQRYCEGDFWYWDGKITTFPGLYIVAAAPNCILRAIGWSARIPCLVQDLRLANGVLFGAVLCPIATIELSRRLHPSTPLWRLSLNAIALNTFPVHFFACDLYYTDAGALGLALACVCILAAPAGRGRRRWLSAAAAAAAIGFRQTNAVWAGFGLGLGVLLRFGPKGRATNNKGKPTATAAEETVACLKLVWARRGEVLAEFWPTLAVLASFVLFVLRNGGVVVGDRDAHKPKLHLAQVCYFGAVTFAARLPAVAASWTSGRPRRRAGRAAMAVLTLLCAACAAWSSLAHPYLLADNRHYTFYVWRKWLGRGLANRLTLAPVYAACLLWAWTQVGRSQGFLACLGLFLCVAAALCPAELLEFRYFVVPHFLCALLAEPATGWGAASTAACNLAVCAVLEAVFLYKPFVWPDGTTARFMW